MNMDALDLYNFYNSTLGRIARHDILKIILAVWPEMQGHTVLGLGYTTPYLKHFLNQTNNIISVMPADIGVVAWPQDGPGKTVLAALEELPIDTKSIDRVLVVHGLENALSIKDMLTEVWRVLKPNGKVLVISPNRHSLWSQSSKTPFGQGHPFTLSQLSSTLKENMFSCIHSNRGLYVPPSKSRLILSGNRLFESFGPYIIPQFSGVISIEAVKQVCAMHPVRTRNIKLPEILSARTT